MTDKIPIKIIERIAFLVVAIIFLIVMGLAGKMDYKDDILSEKIYIQNVCEGLHPDYKEWNIKCENRK